MRLLVPRCFEVHNFNVNGAILSQCKLPINFKFASTIYRGYSTGHGFFHQSACPRLVIIFALRDPALPSAHSPPATVFFPAAICRGSTAERSSYLYHHAVGSPRVDNENIWGQNDWQLGKIDTKMSYCNNVKKGWCELFSIRICYSYKIFNNALQRNQIINFTAMISNHDQSRWWSVIRVL